MGRTALALAVLALAAGCSRTPPAAGDGHDSASPDPHVARGPHGGRMFEAEGLRLELRIHEEGAPPEFRAHLTDDRGRVIDPAGAALSVALDRFGGRRDSLLFRAEPGSWKSLGTVDEPHSFVARVHLDRHGKRHTWTYEQVEGRVELSPDAIAAGGIETGLAGPRPIEVRIEAPGEIRLNADRVVQVRPRFAGVIRELPRGLGDLVRTGDVLAVVHSNESLADYEIVAPMEGTLVSRHAAVGQAVEPSDILFTLADLASVWADFPLYPQFATRVRIGQPVRVRSQGADPLTAEARVRYVGPLLEQDTRISYGRASIPNGSGRWTPGLFVTAAITVEQARVGVAVREEAVLRYSFGPAVFRADGARFELQPIETGRSDGEWTEVVRGLEAGARYVTRNAFLLKAELGKSDATHDH
jgi:cobalt-zinc-cadmium efflux system membrane fusion protein